MAPGCLLSCAVLLVLDVLVIGLAAGERTMAMVKPDGVRANHTEAIKSIIRRSGLDITMEKTLQLDFITAEAFYSEHSGKPFFEELISFMTRFHFSCRGRERKRKKNKRRNLCAMTKICARTLKRSGPIVAMVLEQDNAVTNWRMLIGPTDPQKARSEQPNSIRALFGSSTTQNCVHGSDSQIAANREIMILFRDVQEDKDVKPWHDEL